MDLSFRDWAGLPAHIVDMLVSKLDQLADYVHFSGICPEWRCGTLEANVIHKNHFDVLKASRKKLPMLLLDTHENNNDEWRRHLYSVTDGKIYTIKLPIPYKYRFLGSSLGWLFCVEENMAITLVNPLKNDCISLPEFQRPPDYIDYHMRKGILISDPRASSNNFGVVVLYTCWGKLALFKSGDCCWNYIKSRLQVSDIIYYKDKLYGISSWGQFVQIDLDSGTIKTIIRGSERNSVDRTYLVESQDGELLMVRRVWIEDDEESYFGEGPNVEDHVANEENADIDDNVGYRVVICNGPQDDFDDDEDDDEDDDDDDSPEYLSYEFKVFKMTHLTEESPTWVEVNNIGEQALFVGDNHSVSFSTTDFPGCMSNSIYYTSEHHHSYYSYTYYGLKEDSGIFNLEDGKIYKHHASSSYKCTQPPIWFLPNP